MSPLFSRNLKIFSLFQLFEGKRLEITLKCYCFILISVVKNWKKEKKGWEKKASNSDRIPRNHDIIQKKY